MLATHGCISRHSDDGSSVPAEKIRLRREAERIIQWKVHISCLEDGPGVHRVWPPDDECPRLAMSRAFGDYCVNDYGLSFLCLK